MPQSVRQLIDQYLSLQWCRENIVVPLEIRRDVVNDEDVAVIAIANLTYLATIGKFIKQRFRASGLHCQFVELDAREIESILDNASSEELIEVGYPLSSAHAKNEEILEALRAANDEEDEEAIMFDFDDSQEELVAEEISDLSVEMLGSQIQRGAAQILIETCRSNVSDIHIEPREDGYKVRVRRDGVMQSYISMTRPAGIKLTACLKVMAKMNVAERRAAQDGKILRHFEGQQMEFRCSTAPGKHGEKMVIRILNSNADFLSLDTLIYNEEILTNFRSLLNEATGVVIIAGPTGSGKSTTIASALREKDNGELNIVTAEDPIEYNLGGNIQQFPVLRAKGQTFANLLRAFLRQDPDIILIGELRDSETAECIFDTAETGHQVFTSLYVESCAQAIRYLQLCDIPAQKLYMVKGAILVQKLLRRVCPKCSAERPCSSTESRWLGIDSSVNLRYANCLTEGQKEQRLTEGSLCTHCQGTGYRGRIAVYELAIFTPEIMDRISKISSLNGIQTVLEESGVRSLLNYAKDLVLSQQTTVEEVYRVLSPNDNEKCHSF